MFAAMLAQFGSQPFSNGPPAIFMFFFVAIFALILGTIVFSVGRGIKEWADNNQQPVLTVPAKVVAKRSTTSVSSSSGAGDHHGSTSSTTTDFATFEFESGDRKEFVMSAREFGLLAEGDAGQLTFQGTRYQGFQRAMKDAAGQPVPASVPAPVGDAGNAAPEAAPEGESFCPFCGVPVGTDFKFCPKCGKVLPEYTEIPES